MMSGTTAEAKAARRAWIALGGKQISGTFL
jgi:hypothetical protein